MAKTGSRSLGAFKGVFVPTFLTIIGVILFLRLGFIVGSAGIVGTIAIILLAVSVTLSTGLSLSSIITNIRVGAGGAYSIISKTLGLEVGGSVGIPLYLAQTFSVALYIFGFMEAWRFIFPEHPKVFILLGAFIAVFLLTFISTKLAIRTQTLVFGVLILALISVFAGGNWWNQMLTVPTVGKFPTDFWALFALFFPAVTGLMAGVGMSGELSDPKKQIPKGVLTALGVTVSIYILMVFWFGYTATPQELMNNNLLIVGLSAFGPIVLAGILASTFSSALTTMVAAPRILQAMGDNSVLPMSEFFAKKSKEGEPRHATLVTAGIVGASLFLGRLDAIAPVLTMFFLITYSMINLVVFIEQTLGLVSFRPTLKIPRLVPLYGAVSSVVFMFYINVISGLVALGFLFFTYLILVKRSLKPKHGDVRSGLFLALSEWAAKKVIALPESTKHIWKPNILLPVRSTSTLLGNFPIIKSITFPNGTLSVLGMKVEGEDTELTPEEIDKEMEMLPPLVKKFGKEGIFTNYTEVDVDDYVTGVSVSMQAIEGQFFHPNILFLPTNPSKFKVKELEKIFDTARKEDSGLMIFSKDESIGLGSQEDIHIWIPSEALEAEDFYEDNEFDLGMLIGYRLHRNWVGKINLHICVKDDAERDQARSFLNRIVYEARFPSSTIIHTSIKNFDEALRDSPKGDIHILPVRSVDHMRDMMERTKNTNRTYLYVMDSSHEDVLA